MEPSELIDALLELASEVELPVRLVGDVGSDLTSSVVRLRGRAMVVLSRSDPVEAQIDVLARALRRHAAALLENRYLPPAVRERIEAAGP